MKEIMVLRSIRTSHMKTISTLFTTRLQLPTISSKNKTHLYQTKFMYQTKNGNRNKKKQDKANKSQISQSSTRWLNRQKKDKYAKMARDDGLPSRAIYKLEQIDHIALLKRKKKDNKSKRKKSFHSSIKNMSDMKDKRLGGLFMKGDTVIGECQ